MLSLSLVIMGLDDTVIDVALPSIQEQLVVSGSTLQWIVDAYLLAFEACCPQPAVFWINVPVALTALLLGLRLVPESRDPNPGLLDTVGVLLSVPASSPSSGS